MKQKKNIIIGVLALALFAGILFYLVQKEQKNTENVSYIPYEQFINMVERKEIHKVYLTNQSKLKFYTFSQQSYRTDNPRKEDFKEYLLLNGVAVDECQGKNTGSVLQVVIFLGVLFFGFRLIMKNSSAQKDKSFYKNWFCEENKLEIEKIQFDHVAGNTEAKESVMDLVDFIQDPGKYAAYGARMPRGIIFYGSPGTGKTLLAKAIAGEAGVPFFSVCGSDFVQMYVGVGAARIRELFKQAREAKKAVIFIDEIDALGKKRAANTAGGNEERDQTLNALLTEMSGFHENQGIIVVAATNRLDILDDALLRPGRFDRQIEIGLPETHAREMILKLHARNKPLSSEVDLKKIARQTVYFSGAMLESLLNEAAIFAAKDKKQNITLEDIDKAYYTILAGSEKKDRADFQEKDRKITAYHEAGHALMTKLIAPENTVSKVTIIPSTKGAGGFTVNIPPCQMYQTKKQLENQIMINLAGRIAEEVTFGNDAITTGASGDIEKATSILKDCIARYGMSESFGMLHWDSLSEIAANTAENPVLAECKIRMAVLYQQAKELIQIHYTYLEQIAAMLLEKETIEEEDLAFIQ